MSDTPESPTPSIPFNPERVRKVEYLSSEAEIAKAKNEWQEHRKLACEDGAMRSRTRRSLEHDGLTTDSRELCEVHAKMAAFCADTMAIVRSWLDNTASGMLDWEQVFTAEELVSWRRRLDHAGGAWAEVAAVLRSRLANEQPPFFG